MLASSRLCCPPSPPPLRDVPAVPAGSTQSQRAPASSSEAIRVDPAQPCGFGRAPELSPVRLQPLLISRSKVRILHGPSQNTCKLPCCVEEQTAQDGRGTR